MTEMDMMDAVFIYMKAALNAQPGAKLDALTFDEVRAAYNLIPVPSVGLMEWARRMEFDLEPRDENGLTEAQKDRNEVGIAYLQSLQQQGGGAVSVEVVANDSADEDAA